MDNVIGCSSARSVTRHLGVAYSTVWNVLRKMVHCFPYRISYNQQWSTGRNDYPLNEHFFVALKWIHRNRDRFSGAMRPISISDVTVNTYNCRIWNMENPRTIPEIPIHSPKVTVLCGFTATFLPGPFFFEEATRDGPVTCICNMKRLQTLDSVYSSFFGNVSLKTE